jgi:hypothetical protein
MGRRVSDDGRRPSVVAPATGAGWSIINPALKHRAKFTAPRRGGIDVEVLLIYAICRANWYKPTEFSGRFEDFLEEVLWRITRSRRGSDRAIKAVV